MPKWLLPTMSEILMLHDPASQAGKEQAAISAKGDQTAQSALRAEREWFGAIAALSGLLQQMLQPQESSSPIIDLSDPPSVHGIVLSGPLPVFSQPDLTTHFSTWTLTANPLQSPHWMPWQLLPAGGHAPQSQRTTSVLPLVPGDPLAEEHFCLVMAPCFSLVMVLGENLEGQPAFLFSFVPEVVQQAWQAIRPRILLMNSYQVDFLDELAQQFPAIAPDYKTVMQFSRLLLENLPDPLEDLPPRIATPQPVAGVQTVSESYSLLETSIETSSFDVELLKAIAHEVRTPLTTIRTLTRSLLKRADLPPDVLKRLGIIDRECNEQVDRFDLIFRVAELETSTRQSPVSLTRTSLSQVFQQSIPRWQQQANQRQLTLDVTLPPRMPMVVSDPTMLDQALTSLIERFTRNLPSGSRIQVDVGLAGNQLKLQMQSNSQEENPAVAASQTHSSPLKSIGHLLMFQPETGCLSLNLAVTKNLFQALGGKLIVRKRPQQGEIMTVYLPLEASHSLFDSATVLDV